MRSFVRVGRSIAIHVRMSSRSAFVRSCWAFVHKRRSFVRAGHSFTGDVRSFVRAGRSFTRDVRSCWAFVHRRRSFVRVGRSFTRDVRSFVLGVRSHATFVRSCWAFVHRRRSFVRVGRSFTGNVRSFALLGLGLTEEFGFRKECLWPSRSRGAPGVFPGHCPRFQVDAPVTGPLLVFLGPFRESGGLSGLWVSTSGSPGNSSAL